MKNYLKRVIRKITPKKIQNIFIRPLHLAENKLLKMQLNERTLCYSQEGEDLILETFFDEVKNGFFVDIGAYDPIRFSNTYLFYLKGWTGINIDARPESMNDFDEIRPKDINLEIAIGQQEEMLKLIIR